jgi:hypothetical protein
MTSISPVGSVSATSSATAVSTAYPTAVKQAAAAVAAGPAATVQLSSAAQAKIKGDKDWTPGAHIDSL